MSDSRGQSGPGRVAIALVVAVAGVTAAALAATWSRPFGSRDGSTRTGAPTIAWGAPIGHADRGPCTSCHRVVTGEGERMPAITALSSMPHEFRGVCNNCHAVRVSSILALLPASAMPNPAGPTTALGSVVSSLLARASEE